jgi:hypothetical protein
MKQIFGFSLTLLCTFTFLIAEAAKLKKEKGLPYEPDTTAVKLEKLPQENTINLNFHLGLPKTQKLNRAAPSFVGVYEREKGSKEWTETARFDLNEIATFTDDLDMDKMIQLRSPTSEVAIHSTVFHCGKEPKTACYIQGFRGIASRTTKKVSSTVPFYIEGQMK